MVELALIYQGCKAAHAGIREGIELYKQFKEDGADVSEIIHEITGKLGSFFSHREQYEEASAAQKASPPKELNINEEAMNRVVRVRELQRMETELREMIIYEMGMPGLWSEFDEMRQIVLKERNELAAQKKRQWSWPLGVVGSSLRSTRSRQQLHLPFLYGVYCSPY